jgi:hypothetical protein
MPVLSLGSMRFQQSWIDLSPEQISAESQAHVAATLARAVHLGFHHIETARHYGSSERQIGWVLPALKDPGRILQSKVPPQEDPAAFEAELALSCERLGVERLDLLAIHGINQRQHLEQTLRPGGCLAAAGPHRGRGLLHPCPPAPDPGGDRRRPQPRHGRVHHQSHRQGRPSAHALAAAAGALRAAASDRVQRPLLPQRPRRAHDQRRGGPALRPRPSPRGRGAVESGGHAAAADPRAP